jgi:hypothetical protein
MLKRAIFGIITVAVALAAPLVGLEFAMRVWRGQLFTFRSQLPPPANRFATPRAEYDARLGWIPKRGAVGETGGSSWSIDSAGLRRTGTIMAPAVRPILAIGDSFTFGDEVQDGETWPAQLQQELGIPVLNAGVFAYGIDQSFLRATQLLEQYRPQAVVLAFIGHDVVRNEMLYYSAWKPYFEHADGELILRNVPVPRGPAPPPRLATLRAAVGYSLLGSAMARRIAPRWWRPSGVVRAHRNGEVIALELLARLDSTVRAADARLLIVALGTNGRISGNRPAENVISRAGGQRLPVLDLIPDVDSLLADSLPGLFRPRGHFSPQLNRHVARRIAAILAPPPIAKLAAKDAITRR